MEESLLLQLHKLPNSSISEEILENIFQIIWKTRKTGLQTHDKSSIQSQLNLPSSQTDSVLACLRLIVRKCVKEGLIGDDLLKIFPPGISVDLENIVVKILRKYQTQWKQEAANEQTTWQRPSNVHVHCGIPPSTPFSATDAPSLMWPRQQAPSTRFSHNDTTSATPNAPDTSVPFDASVLLQRVDGADDNLAILPHLKSMTWTMKNQKSKPTERVAIISLKLHDYTKSPSGEREVKFQLSKDTLEAMLTSMTYISNQLSNTGGSSGPLQKRPRV
ncbi:hypothetical protein ACHQM5_012226 [Ranunculus cassubicifolius]